MSLKVYLAGPDVFLRDAATVQARKAEIARAAGFVPVVPGDLDVQPEATRLGWGIAISRIDESMMNDCDLIIANLTPFRGISADVGTVFELGYMCAQGKPVYGYSNSARSYLERNAEFYDGRIERLSEERWAAPDETNIENFDMGENLMIEGGIVARNGVFVRRETAPEVLWTDLTAFGECVAVARERLLREGA